MAVALERRWQILSLKNTYPVALSVTSGVGGWSWTTSMSAMLITATI